MNITLLNILVRWEPEYSNGEKESVKDPPIMKRNIHMELKQLLLRENYQGFVSIEMGKQDDMEMIEAEMRYIKDVFG